MHKFNFKFFDVILPLNILPYSKTTPRVIYQLIASQLIFGAIYTHKITLKEAVGHLSLQVFQLLDSPLFNRASISYIIYYLLKFEEESKALSNIQTFFLDNKNHWMESPTVELDFEFSLLESIEKLAKQHIADDDLPF